MGGIRSPDTGIGFPGDGITCGYGLDDRERERFFPSGLRELMSEEVNLGNGIYPDGDPFDYPVHTINDCHPNREKPQNPTKQINASLRRLIERQNGTH